jgi:hypothetical protein
MARGSIVRPRSLAYLERQAQGRTDANAEPDADSDLIDGNANRGAEGNSNPDAEGHETRGRPVFVAGRWGCRHIALLP